MLNLDRKESLTILENALTWVVVMGMLIYGLAKGMQFQGASAIDTPVSELTGMQLMWAFYGYSTHFLMVIGALEVLGGILLFFRRTRLLGCLLTSTILVNIILQDIFYGVNQGALHAAIIYQTCLLMILWLNRQTLLECWQVLSRPHISVNWNKKSWFILSLSFLLFILFRSLEYFWTTGG